MNARDLHILRREGAAGAERLVREAEEKRARRLAKSLQRRKAEARTEEEELALFQAAKAEAFARAGRVVELVHGVEVEKWPARCEVYTDGKRCELVGVDPDHVIGGAYKADSEALGAEGLQVMCRCHHDLKTVYSPSRSFWLDQAKEHAIRIASRGLLKLVELAMARHDAKHRPTPFAPRRLK